MNDEAERLMDAMDSIYMVLMTMDYSETITGGLRRRTDTLRSVLERTRGELTLSQQLHHLQQQIAEYGITEFLGGAATADYGE
jgi:translin